MVLPLAHCEAASEGSTTRFPVSVQLAARYGDEATLFRLAGQLEQAQPWFDRKPAMAV
jgi:amidase